MVRVSNERLLSFLAGLPSIYLYFSGLGQHFQAFAYLKYIVYPLCYFLGIIAYIRIIKVKKDFLAFLAITAIILFNFVINPNFSKFAIVSENVGTLLLSDIFLLFFIAIPSFFLSKSRLRLDILLRSFTQIGALICALFTLYFILEVFVYKSSFDYMNVTYGALPWLLYVMAFSSHNKKRSLSLLSALDVVLIMISGCRGAALTTLIFLFLVYLWYIKDSFTIKKLLLVLALLTGAIVLIINFRAIVVEVYKLLSGLGFKSRTLELYLGSGYEHGLGHYSDRAAFQTTMLERINLFGYGIYSDRAIAIEGVYAHNVFLEWLLDFGVVFGVPLILCFLYFTIKNIHIYFKSDSRSTMIFIAMCISILCCKYMVSSSYLHSPEFWAVYGIYISMEKKSIKQLDNMNYS